MNYPTKHYGELRSSEWLCGTLRQLFDVRLLILSCLFSSRNLETISIGTCRLHGSPKMGPSTNVSPHHRLHHHHHLHLHRSHSRVQSLDLMDDLPLPFQTDQHHLNILVQESPMLSPNPPPSVVESNGQTLPQPILNISSNATLASGQTSSAAHSNINNVLSSNSNFNNTSSTITTTNVIINNIKTNTTTIGMTNPESSVVQPTTTATPGTNSKWLKFNR